MCTFCALRSLIVNLNLLMSHVVCCLPLVALVSSQPTVVWTPPAEERPAHVNKPSRNASVDAGTRLGVPRLSTHVRRLSYSHELHNGWFVHRLQQSCMCFTPLYRLPNSASLASTVCLCTQHGVWLVQWQVHCVPSCLQENCPWRAMWCRSCTTTMADLTAQRTCFSWQTGNCEGSHECVLHRCQARVAGQALPPAAGEVCTTRHRLEVPVLPQLLVHGFHCPHSPMAQSCGHGSVLHSCVCVHSMLAHWRP